MTLASFQKGFIFLKTRKTAGTSVEMYLQPFCTAPGTEVIEHTPMLVSRYGVLGSRMGSKKGLDGSGRPWVSHMNAALVKTRLGPLIWDGFFKISVVRNPFERVLSSFYWRFRIADLPVDQAEAVDKFRRFVVRAPMTSDYDIVHVDDKFVPDFTVRTENIKEDLAELAKILDLDTSNCRLPVTKKAATNRPKIPTSEWYDKETIDVIQTKFKWVFDRFDYPTTPSSKLRK